MAIATFKEAFLRKSRIALLGGELILLKFYMVTGLDVKLPQVDLFCCFIAVEKSYWPFILRYFLNRLFPTFSFTLS